MKDAKRVKRQGLKLVKHAEAEAQAEVEAEAEEDAYAIAAVEAAKKAAAAAKEAAEAQAQAGQGAGSELELKIVYEALPGEVMQENRVERNMPPYIHIYIYVNFLHDLIYRRHGAACGVHANFRGAEVSVGRLVWRCSEDSAQHGAVPIRCRSDIV